MKTVYLDTNVYADFAEGNLPRDQYDALRAAVSSGAARVVYTMALMDEQVNHSLNKPWGKSAVRLARDLCGRQGVLYHVEVLNNEIQAVLSGNRVPSMFMRSGSALEVEFFQDIALLLKAPGSVTKKIRQFVDIVRDEQEDFRKAMRIAKDVAESMWAKGPKKRRPDYPWYRKVMFNEGGYAQALTRAALRQAGYARRRSPRLLGLSRHAPMYSMYLEVNVAYAYGLTVMGISTKRSFGKDIHHALYAARCDTFVTQDADFRKILHLIPRKRRCAVYHWEDFAKALESWCRN